jgi:hypothetical protein
MTSEKIREHRKGYTKKWRVGHKNDGCNPMRPDIEKLKKFLLRNYGGSGFQFDFYLFSQLDKNDIKKLFSKGQFINGKHFILKKMKANSCHQNSAKLSIANKFDIYTGLALSRGIWRAHTWIQNPKTKIWTETTIKNEGYYGFKLDKNEQEKFIKNNIRIDVFNKLGIMNEIKPSK